MPVPANCSNLDLPWKTSRLILRPLADCDFDDMFVLCTHPEICRYIRPPMSGEAVAEHIQDRQRPWFFEDGKWCSLAVLERGKDRRLLGEMVFRMESKVDSRAEIGYRFHPDSQGKGYAFEASKALVDFLFDAFALHKLVAYCEPANLASRRLLSKLGMIEEGLQREHVHVDGEFRDLCSYGLLRREFEARAANP